MLGFRAVLVARRKLRQTLDGKLMTILMLSVPWLQICWLRWKLLPKLANQLADPPQEFTG